MRQYRQQVKETKEIRRVICNKCGKEVLVTDGIPEKEMFSVDYRWGYFSGKDGKRHRFELCEECYDALLASFAIPADIEE